MIGRLFGDDGHARESNRRSNLSTATIQQTVSSIDAIREVRITFLIIL